MSFIKNLEPEFAALPDELRASVAVSLKKWDEQLTVLNLSLDHTPEFMASIVQSLVLQPVCCRKLYAATGVAG